MCVTRVYLHLVYAVCLLPGADLKPMFLVGLSSVCLCHPLRIMTGLLKYSFTTKNAVTSSARRA